jgi:hypothetical protein
MARDKLKRPPTSGTRRGNGAGWGGPANGDGWGGPAKGAAFYPSKGHSGRILARRAADESLIDTLCEFYWNVAHDLDAPTALRLTAATHMLNRIEGPPVAKVVAPEVDEFSLMTDEELEAERARLLAKMGARS